MGCNYNFKQGWWCSRERNHSGPCALSEVRTFKIRLRDAIREFLRK